MSFDEFFRRATGIAAGPLPYQRRLAEDRSWPALIEIPTGLGKTFAVLAAWFWRRQAHDPRGPKVPRRLVYCLPMRVLVEQTERIAREMVARLGVRTRVVVLMGGVEDEGGWDIDPAEDLVLIGTQDMLLSRALNRGYGMSRYRWPLHFGLLNNDALWVVDEVQLVGRAVATTSQLQALRRKLGTVQPTLTSWMSATLDEAWLQTVDAEDADLAGRLTLDDEDLNHPTVAARRGARKMLSRASAVIGDNKGLAREVLKAHRTATRTLVIVNTVDRAQEVFAALHKEKPKASVVLLHSRFRPTERSRALERALESPSVDGTIVVSTQVIEAGVDLTSSTLFTELAPWASLVQRFGRCNRSGEEPAARIFWVGLQSTPTKGSERPYRLEELIEAQTTLQTLDDVGPAALPRRPMRLDPGVVLRRRDLLDLFDTTQDLSGSDVDVSRFIREADDNDVRIAWRAAPPGPGGLPHREELCPAPIGAVRDWVEKGRRRAWSWNFLQGEWEQVRRVSPGQVLVVDGNDGGYEPELGFIRKGTLPVPEVRSAPRQRWLHDEKYEGDPLSELGDWYTLTRHSDDVARETARLCESLALPVELAQAAIRAGRWHDAGKAHPVWQAAAKSLGDDPPQGLVAKSRSARGSIRYARRGFRHELASALLALQNGQPDLVSYLIACHHGKVRGSLRALPIETPPGEEEGTPSANRRFARGVWEGDQLPEIDLAGGDVIPATQLKLTFMDLGDDPETGASWTSRVLGMRDDPALGPFRLAFLEGLVKCADERVSMRAVGKDGIS